MAVTPAVLSLFLIQWVSRTLLAAVKSSSRGRLIESASVVHRDLRYGHNLFFPLLSSSYSSLLSDYFPLFLPNSIFFVPFFQRTAVRQLERLLCMAQKTDDHHQQPHQSTTTTSTAAASAGTSTSSPPLSTSVPLPPATTASSSSLSSYDLTGHSVYIHTLFSSNLLLPNLTPPIPT